MVDITRPRRPMARCSGNDALGLHPVLGVLKEAKESSLRANGSGRRGSHCGMETGAPRPGLDGKGPPRACQRPSSGGLPFPRRASGGGGAERARHQDQPHHQRLFGPVGPQGAQGERGVDPQRVRLRLLRPKRLLRLRDAPPGGGGRGSNLCGHRGSDCLQRHRLRAGLHGAFLRQARRPGRGRRGRARGLESGGGALQGKGDLLPAQRRGGLEEDFDESGFRGQEAEPGRDEAATVHRHGSSLQSRRFGGAVERNCGLEESARVPPRS
mmetsp:Transcript_73222/g.138155  ORF Transcript_73222/g.138155 Transcript_73222/m.138155 type:complete len:269 (-) Transcript_73222:1055-1861(-)